MQDNVAITNMMVEVDKITTPRYQRDIRKPNRRKIESIVKNFDRLIYDPIKISFRDGYYYVFDGQNRVEAFKRRGEKQMEARVYKGLTEEQEAALFARQHDNQVRVSIGDRWNASEYAGNEMPEEEEIRNAVAAQGYTIGSKANGKNRVFKCITTLKKLYSEFGCDGLGILCDVVNQAWGDCAKATHEMIVEAIIAMMRTYGSDIKWERLITALGKITPEKFMRDATAENCKGMKRGALHMVKLYNKGMRSDRLDERMIG